uniref:Uncharacterized protein n=1 Tax=Lepeophtheirus salmonis TaxID=72036 RepID=A0A0K2V934_LEPSM
MVLYCVYIYQYDVSTIDNDDFLSLYFIY